MSTAVLQVVSDPGSPVKQGGRGRERSLRLLSVDGVVELLHLLLREDGVAEVGLELLQGQLAVVWERRSGQRGGNTG